MSKNYDSIYKDVIKELIKAEDKFPRWPNDALHALGIVNEEHGELCQAVLGCCGESKYTMEEIEEEAIQTIAMLFRFVTNMDKCDFKVSYFNDITE